MMMKCKRSTESCIVGFFLFYRDEREAKERVSNWDKTEEDMRM